jgi:predicted nucleic acid-binding protein
VADEVQRYGPDDPAARAVRECAWLHPVADAAVPASVLAWDLGVGESVIAWAVANAGAIAVLDDLAARRCARAHGLRVKGTLGLVIDAKRAGAIPSARAVIDELRAAGMYLSDRVLAPALAEIGE